MDIEDLIQEEDVVIILTNGGYIKRLSIDEYRSQRRGGKGMIAMKMKEEDTIYKIVKASTHDTILFFSSDGKVYSKKAYEIPHGSRQSKGRAIVNFLPSGNIVELIPVSNFEGNVIFATENGIVKKSRLKLFSKIRATGIKAINVENDKLISAKISKGGEKIILASYDGYACMFDEKELRSMGRTARGVIGMRRRVASMEVASSGDILTITENGYGKRTSISEYRITRRGAKGVKTIKVNERNGRVVGVMAVSEEDEILLSTKYGMMIRIKAMDIRRQGRNTMGVRLMKLNEGDKIVSFAKI